MTEHKNQPDSTNDEAVDSVIDEIDSQNDASPEEGSPDQVVAHLEQLVAQFRERELKAQAELENFRKRLLRDTEQQLKYASSGLVHDLLEVVDNLQRANDAASKAGESSGLVDGVKMVQQQFVNVLAKHNCKPIPAVGQPFDPNVHQAIAQQPSDEFPAGTVVLETSVGYTLFDRVVRPSMVVVSTGSGNSGSGS